MTNVSEGLRTVLDNLITHHELTRVAGNTHSRPDRCEFVEQARAALAHATPEGLDEDRFFKALRTEWPRANYPIMPLPRVFIEKVAAEYARLGGGTMSEERTRKWARWIVRQGRNPDRACPECGPIAWGAKPARCVSHEALAFLGAGR